MKKNIALLTAVCLTTVFFTACGSTNTGVTGDPSLSAGVTAGKPSFGGFFDGFSNSASVEFNDAITSNNSPRYENNESYSSIAENGFILTSEENTSTFSIDVDTASYSNVRRMIQTEDYGNIPDAVRIEEMINYFNYDYPVPADDTPFSVTTELSPCPWNPENQVMLIGLQADKIDLSSRKPMNLVFLIDVSGSMFGEDRLGLVQKAVNMLAENLNENDRVSIVTYAGYESVVLEGTPGNEIQTISEAINGLKAGGSTAGEAGIKKAYEIAQKYFIQGGNNRVLLATDGDLNVGVSSPEELKALVEEKRETGVNLSVLGFGAGNLKDDNMETLADNGNGNYAYIDSELEAKKVLVQEMGGTFYTVAKDVKLQLEFDPETVSSYRLIGYENRVLEKEDFDNDAVDAGEIGAGHSVTALYEIVPTSSGADHLFKLAMRYKEPDGEQSMLKEFDVMKSENYSEQLQKNSAFASAVAEFGMMLKHSPYSGEASYEQIINLLGQTDIQDEYRSEFKKLVERAYASGLLPGSSSEPPLQQTTQISSEILPEQITDIYVHGQNSTVADEDNFMNFIKQNMYEGAEVDSIPDETLIQNAKDSGIYIRIQFEDKDVELVMTADEAQIILNSYSVYLMPEIIQNELRMMAD